MMRLAVLPAALVTVTAAAVVAYVLGSQQGGPESGAPDGATIWGVLAGSLLVVCAVVVGAALLASSEARATTRRYVALRRASERSQADIRALLRRLEQGERPRASELPVPAEPPADAFGLLAHELSLAQHTAEAAVAEAAVLVRAGTSGSDEKVEVFVNLARRLQSLVHREIELLDELENEVEDPDLLKGLFHVDHLATRIRRHAENLAVLGGAVSRRQWTRPVTLTEVLRSSIAEVEQYPRVKLVPPIEGKLRGHAVADVIHLLAELVENATIFSAPQTQVLLRAQHVTAGLAVEVEDRGLGMTAAEQNRMNTLLADPEQFDVGELLSDGRIGLFVVSALARRHGIVVRLQSNIYGGIQAVLVLPHPLLGDTDDSSAAAVPAPSASLAPSHARASGRELPGPRGHHPVPVRSEHPPQHISVPSHQEPQPVRAAAPPSMATSHHPQGSVPRQTPAPPVQARDARPQLPKRRRQEHLVPELREQPARFAGDNRGRAGESESDSGHDPGLMAAFRRGTDLADESAASGAHTPVSGGETPRPAS